MTSPTAAGLDIERVV